MDANDFLREHRGRVAVISGDVVDELTRQPCQEAPTCEQQQEGSAPHKEDVRRPLQHSRGH